MKTEQTKFWMTGLLVSALCGANAMAGMVVGQEVGIDFSGKGNTPGAGQEPSFMAISKSESDVSAVDTEGQPIDGVTLTFKRIGGPLSESNVGFGCAGGGDYRDTPFSDLSFNDGIYCSNRGRMRLYVQGLNPALGYDIQLLTAGPLGQDNPVHIVAGGQTASTSYNAIRKDSVIHPVEFSGVATDDAGVLPISFYSEKYFSINAIHIRAVKERRERILERIDTNAHCVPKDKNLSKEWLDALTSRGERKIYRGEELFTIGMPCGGVAAGQLYVRGDGTLARWWIFNEEISTYFNRGVEDSGYKTYRPESRIAQGMMISATGADGAASILPLSRDGFDDIGFIGEYPVATVLYEKAKDPSFPLAVTAEVFSPFIPLNAKDSSMPITIMSYTVKNSTDAVIDVRLGGWLENAALLEEKKKGIERVNSVERFEAYTGVMLGLRGSKLPVNHRKFGNMMLAVLDDSAKASADWGGQEHFSLDFKETETVASLDEAAPCGAVASSFSLYAGETKTVRFAISWFFPNQYNKSPCCPGLVGRSYVNHFNDAKGVMDYVSGNIERLYCETMLYRDTLYLDTTLPYWFVQRSAMSSANLASDTVQWWKSGRFYSYEGVGFCFGTCGHVWNYAQALSRLFPELERSVRINQDFNENISFAASGRINFRGDNSTSETFKRWGYIPDAQAGYILKAYREHLMSADQQFLDQLWPKIKKAMEYLLERDGRDGAVDGTIGGLQHFTDSLAWGPNTFTGSLYLAALRASEEMAEIKGDEAFAETSRNLFELGSKWSTENLWNGEYFFHKYSEAPKGALYDDKGGHNKGKSYGNGCLSDQLFGQNWAHQLGLGYLYSKAKVDSALKSVFKYNWAPDVAVIYEEMPARFILLANEGEAGMIGLTHPIDDPPRNPIGQNADPWTGYEYQAASHMIREGLLTEGLSIAYGVHQRYDGAKHNPWNEIEGGDHYVRSMAAWGMLLAASGFEYNGPAGSLSFAPTLGASDFKGLFTAAEGWGSLIQKRSATTQVNAIELKWGSLTLKSIMLKSIGHVSGVVVTFNGAPLEGSLKAEGEMLTLSFSESLTLTAGDKLKVILPIN